MRFHCYTHTGPDADDLVICTTDADSPGKAAELASEKHHYAGSTWTVVHMAEDSDPVSVPVVERTTYHAALGGSGRMNPQSGLGTPIVVPQTGPQGTQVIPTLPGGLRTNEAR
jgi:hypothetical protein